MRAANPLNKCSFCVSLLATDSESGNSAQQRRIFVLKYNPLNLGQGDLFDLVRCMKYLYQQFEKKNVDYTVVSIHPSFRRFSSNANLFFILDEGVKLSMFFMLKLRFQISAMTLGPEANVNYT